MGIQWLISSVSFPLSAGFNKNLFNWAIVVFGLVFFIAAGFYVVARQQYVPARHDSID